MLKAVHFKTLETKELLSHKKAATGGVLRKLLLKVLQISQEKICARISFLTKSFKKRHRHRCFHANFVKFLRIPFWRTSSNECCWPYSPLPIKTSQDSELCLGPCQISIMKLNGSIIAVLQVPKSPLTFGSKQM